MTQQASGKIKVSFSQAFGLLAPYIKDRVMGQVKSVWLIILYLIFFQTVILGIRIADASIIAIGIALVVAGLTFFMEGLFLGLMPLGELVGVKLPQKSTLPVILGFALVMGFLATLAEPAIQVLQVAGRAVKPWDAPLLFVLLTKYSHILVYSVGIGVGIAVTFGMLRFYNNWSLKPFIYILVGGLVALTVWAFFDQNMITITGLAWDCGAVTTGPVTVPLVLALGIGISRMVGSAESGSMGFGVVTLASLFPILTVFLLGAFLLGSVPEPMKEVDFFKKENHRTAETLFDNKGEMVRYVLFNASIESQIAYFGGSKERMIEYLEVLSKNESKRRAIFGEDLDALKRWAITQGTEEQQHSVFGSLDAIQKAVTRYSISTKKAIDAPDLLVRNSIVAVKAIGLLTLPLFFVLFVLLREKLPRPDEILMGLLFIILGMGIFSIGIELGLDKLGNQVGNMLPSSFKAIQLLEEKRNIINFDPDMVESAISPEGKKLYFFYANIGRDYFPIPYDEKGFDPVTKNYQYTPTKGPLFRSEGSFWGIAVVLVFAFIMGYGATLAEPALNALGLTVEELTVGTFKKSLLMKAVAIGVGVGIALGVAKVVWDIPLLWLLAPPYLLLIPITKLSTEEFVNIGWDSAGVTTGPITVPLVLAMGLGIGSQVGVVEGFGILAIASVCPILSVLSVGLRINRKRKAALTEVVQTAKEESLVDGI
ncbi:MAG: DUF1538 domain-containing protein [Pseudomonadota bacterium]